MVQQFKQKARNYLINLLKEADDGPPTPSKKEKKEDSKDDTKQDDLSLDDSDNGEPSPDEGDLGDLDGGGMEDAAPPKPAPIASAKEVAWINLIINALSFNYERNLKNVYPFSHIVVGKTTQNIDNLDSLSPSELFKNINGLLPSKQRVSLSDVAFKSKNTFDDANSGASDKQDKKPLSSLEQAPFNNVVEKELAILALKALKFDPQQLTSISGILTKEVTPENAQDIKAQINSFVSSELPGKI